MRIGPPPNFVFILIDDMGYADLSCYGNKAVKTENIDRLAREGVRFTNYVSSAPICSPSRCGLLTGQYPQRWKITSFLETRKANTERGMAQWLDPKAPSVARELKALGYKLSFTERSSGPINAIYFDWKHNSFWGGSSNHGEDYGIGW